MEKKYDHKIVEENIFKLWEDGGYFSAKVDKKKKSYTILLPPPNANGKLHVGHALMIAIEDLLIRRKRMQGYSALWLPGTDHAGFETQLVFEKALAKEGKSRFDYDRETLYQKIWDFVKEQSGVIDKQIKSLGPSMDWSRYTFTLDEKVVNTVVNTFEKMVNDKLVYRDNYMVNFCPQCGTTFADLEVKHVEETSPLYFVRYPLIDRGENDPEHLIVATTRPEPIFVDTHLAVHPDDGDKKHLVGRRVLNPLTDKVMHVIGDKFVDPEFGTGIVKLTPAHDKIDYEVAKKHNLEIISAFNLDGTMNELTGELEGTPVAKAREKVVAVLKSKGLLERIDESYTHTKAVCYKGGHTIEPTILPNWFVKVENLKKPAHDAVKNGQVSIYPKWQETKYHRWMEEMRDWPISRQIVWGIRIPAWYDVEKNPELNVTFLDSKKNVVTGNISALLKKYEFEEIEKGLQNLIAPNNAAFEISRKKPKGHYLQETDTFDTWFSSGQWPLVTLGYPDSEDFNYFYPTSVLETGWEILRFWVSRMIMFGIYLTGEAPFEDVYLHGLVRATDGKKMSKSLGNQVDPLEAVEEFGADALRMGLISGTANGKDFNFPQDKVVSYRNFANKIWNMARFMNMLNERYETEGGKVIAYEDEPKVSGKEDREILEGFSALTKAVDTNIDKYRFFDAADQIYHFMWDEIADKYIEHVKTREDKDVALGVLRYVYKNCLKLLHPFMPFVTEEIWAHVKNENEDMLIVTEWPGAKA